MIHRDALTRMGLFDARLPRYTSYPTANHFATTIGPADVADWLTDLPPQPHISAYIHVPYCPHLCWYCGCRTQVSSREAPLERYVTALEAEMALVAATLPSNTVISQLQFGGGSPGMLPPHLLERMIRAARGLARPAPDMTLSMDLDPTDFDQDRLDVLVAQGLTQANIGVQDYDPGVQRMIGRAQSLAQTAALIQALRQLGIPTIKAELVYGLPGQTPHSMAATIGQLLALEPDRVALQGYAHMPWAARRQSLIPATLLPDARERLTLFASARRLLLWDGLVPVGIDHFARPDDPLVHATAKGRLRRGLHGYSERPNAGHLGIGASSVWHLPQGYAQNQNATSRHLLAVQNGRLPIARGHRFTDQDKLRARAIEMVLCNQALDRDALVDEWPELAAPLDAILSAIEHRFGEAIIADRQGFSLRPGAWPTARLIAAMFDAYDTHRHGYSWAI